MQSGGAFVLDVGKLGVLPEELGYAQQVIVFFGLEEVGDNGVFQGVQTFSLKQ